jgi:hypothetical protein
MATAATDALASSLEWLRRWQQHERLVATGEAVPGKPVPVVAIDSSLRQ